MNGQKCIGLQTAQYYVGRLMHVQSSMLGDTFPTLNIELFKDVPRILKTIDEGRAASGRTKGQPWSLSSRILARSQP